MTTAWYKVLIMRIAGVALFLLVTVLVTVLVPALPGADEVVVRPDTWAQPVELPGCPNLHRIAPDLYRGAQPTAEGMRELGKLGIRTVISLRAFHDDEDEVEGTGLQREQIRFKTWHAENEDVVRFLKLVGDPARRPVFIHCLHGADRTGTMCAIYRMAFQGWSADAAVREMRDGGYGFHEVWSNLPPYLATLDLPAILTQAGITAPVGVP